MSEDEKKQEALNEHSRRLLAHKEIDARVRTLRDQVCKIALRKTLVFAQSGAVCSAMECGATA